MIIPENEAVRRGIVAKSMLNDLKRNTDVQLHFIYQLAAKAPDGIAVECGVHRGGSLVCWAGARAERGPIFAVDNWRSPVLEKFKANIAQAGLNITTYTEDTWRAASHFENGSIAFLFHDAAHGYEWGFLKDLAHWPEKVMAGGIFAIHDYGVWKQSVCVKHFVDAWATWTWWEYLGNVNGLIAFRRPSVEHKPGYLPG